MAHRACARGISGEPASGPAVPTRAQRLPLPSKSLPSVRPESAPELALPCSPGKGAASPGTSRGEGKTLQEEAPGVSPESPDVTCTSDVVIILDFCLKRPLALQFLSDRTRVPGFIPPHGPVDREEFPFASLKLRLSSSSVFQADEALAWRGAFCRL